MTVLYTIDSKFGGFVHLFARWKGSIFKLVWPDLTLFLILYFSCSTVYRFLLDENHQILFEKVASYCEKYGTLIPVSFVLGFYVSLVIGRWWGQYKAIPWIDTMAIWVNVAITGEGDETRLIRRTICRYVCLSITQCFTLISSQAKKRFPTTDHLVGAGLLLENEKVKMDSIVKGIPKYQTHWIPLVWATTMVCKARNDGKINSDTWMKTTIDEINKIQDQCNRLLCFDRIRVPLVYTQVVTLAVYSYFLSCLMGRQALIQRTKFEGNSTVTDSPIEMAGTDELDLIVPVLFTVLQFLFYIGWLKVAQSLVNPFGDDDYDFELNWMIDRHLQVSYSIVDKMHFQNPELHKDPYWDEVIPKQLPHTIASSKYNNDPPVISTARVVMSNDEGEMVLPTQHLSSICTIAKADLKFRKCLKTNNSANQGELNSENDKCSNKPVNGSPQNCELPREQSISESDDGRTVNNATVSNPRVGSRAGSSTPSTDKED